MNVAIVAAVCIMLFAIHTYLLFGHRHKMGSEKNDRSKDIWFSDAAMKLGFFGTLLFEAFCLGRRVFLQTGDYEKVQPYLPFGILDLAALPVNDLYLFLGFLIFLLGVALRLWAVKTLGRLFTFEVGIREGHKIVEQGPYRFLRHPSYTGYLLGLLGVGLAASSGIFLMVVMLGSAVFFTLRIRNEEQMLATHFGDAYKDYMKRTKRLVPFIY